VKLTTTIGTVSLLGAACCGACGRDRARIAYISGDTTLAAVVEQTTRREGAAVRPFPLSATRPDIIGRGDARDVASAEAATADPHLVAVVGHASSRGSLLAAPIYDEAGLPFIAPTATSRHLRDAGPWTFQLAPDDEAEGAFIATFAQDSLGARSITVFYLAADEYGIGLRDGITRALRGRGGAPADAVAILDDSDFERRVAESLRRVTPDAVVLASRTPEAVAVARAVRRRLPHVPLILADGVDGGGFAAGAGPGAAPAWSVAWWLPGSPDPASRAFVECFVRVAGRPPRQQEAMYYDALMVAAQALRAAGPHRDAVRRYLSALGVTRPPYHGITGPISFASGRPTNLVMLRIGDAAAGRPAPR